MKGFREFIGESRKESSRPVFDKILDRADAPSSIIDYFEGRLGTDFLEFSRESEMGGKIAQEFSQGVITKKYRSFINSRSGFSYYYFVVYHGGPILAISSTDWTTWWIDPMWAINDLFSDL
jgi:hypothetical protein